MVRDTADMVRVGIDMFKGSNTDIVWDQILILYGI